MYNLYNIGLGRLVVGNVQAQGIRNSDIGMVSSGQLDVQSHSIKSIQDKENSRYLYNMPNNEKLKEVDFSNNLGNNAMHDGINFPVDDVAPIEQCNKMRKKCMQFQVGAVEVIALIDRTFFDIFYNEK